MIKILRKLSFSLYLQTFDNASIFWLGVKREKQVESWLPPFSNPLPMAWRTLAWLPWARSSCHWNCFPGEGGGGQKNNPHKPTSRISFWLLQFGWFSSFNGLLRLPWLNTIPFSFRWEPTSWSPDGSFLDICACMQREWKRSLSPSSFHRANNLIGLGPHTYNLI